MRNIANVLRYIGKVTRYIAKIARLFAKSTGLFAKVSCYIAKVTRFYLRKLRFFAIKISFFYLRKCAQWTFVRKISWHIMTKVWMVLWIWAQICYKFKPRLLKQINQLKQAIVPITTKTLKPCCWIEGTTYYFEQLSIVQITPLLCLFPWCKLIQINALNINHFTVILNSTEMMLLRVYLAFTKVLDYFYSLVDIDS